MRIVGGTYRGRPLVAPKGHSTRPTADRARQAMFNVLEHAAWSPGVTGRRVIDLFAGSGALGLESLSRGAACCWFVDNDATARRAIETNLAALKCEARGHLRPGDVRTLGAGPGKPFDLAFLDPPYGVGLAETALERLAAGAWLAQDAVVVVERGAAEGDLVAPGYQRLDERAWGAARVSFLTP